MKKMMLAVAAVAAVLGARAADALPEGYEQVEYIRSTGVQWINTGYVPNDTDRIEAKVSFPVLEANMCLWCSRGAATLTNSLSAFVMKSSDVFNPRVDCNDNLAKATGIQLTTTGDYLIVGDGKTRTAYVNDAEFSIAAAEFTPVNPLTLFASYGKDDVSALATADMANWGRYILYFFKVTDKDGNVQVDMVPCRNAEGVHGLYDLRRAKFYPSEGRAAFVGVSDPQPVDILSARNYVQDGLVAQWDAIENAGLGLHDNGAATWVDISSAKKGGDFAVSGGGFLDNALRLGLVSSGAYVTKKMNLTAMTIEVVLMRTSGTASIHRFTVPLADTSDGKYDTTFESWSNDDEALLERIGATRLLGAKPANNKRTTFATRYDVGGYHLFQTTVSGTTTLATGKASDTFEQTNHREIPSRLEFFTGNQNVDVYAVRIYNRRLTDEELTRNRHIDNDRFDSSLPAGVPSNNGALVSDGRQIFETDYHMDKDSRFEIEFAFTTVEAQARICGNDAIEGEFRTSLYANGNKNFAISGGDGFDGRTFGVAGDTKRHTGIFDGPTKKCILVTGTTTKSVDCNQDVTKTATYPLTLFSRWATTDCTSINDTAKARIYACRLYKKINGAYVLQRDYVPCVSNRVAGFYERVHGTFSTGKTLKPFAWTGDVMRIGDAPYIETEGNASQVLNTKYRVGPNTRVTCDFALNQVISYERIFGLERAAAASHARFYVNGNKGFSFSSGDTAANVEVKNYAASYKRLTGVLDIPGGTGTIYEGGEAVGTCTLANPTTQTADDPLVIGSAGTDGTGFAARVPTPMLIYGFRIYESDELVRDYVPYVRHGVAGLKDLKTGDFITSESRPLRCGGDIATDGEPLDGYIESSGSQMIDSGYKVTPSTRIEWDGNFLMSTPSRGTLFGEEYYTGMNVRYYLSSSSIWGWVMEDFASGTPNWRTASSQLRRYPLTARRLNVLDVKNSRMYVVTGGFTNIVEDTSAYKPYANTSAGTLGLFCLHQKPSTSWTYGAHARLYGLRIYEDDAEGRETLVCDFVPFVSNSVPGVLDRVTGAFRAERTKTGSPFLFGGAIESDASSTDACLESTGVQGVPIDYFVVGAKTKVEVDLQLTGGNAVQTRFFGNSLNKDGCNFNCALYLGNDSSSGIFSYAAGDAFQGDWTSNLHPDRLRYGFVIDLPNKKGYCYNADGSLRQATSLTAKSYKNTCGHMFGVFGDCTSADGSTFRYLAKEKIYSVRLSEGGEMKRELVPGCVGGVNGLYDTVTGAFYTDSLGSGVPLKLSGAGIDGAGPSFLVQPKAGHMPRTGGKTLKAFAAGATSYQWYRDGEPIEGATLNSYEIPGEGYRETSKFAVKAFFTVNGEPVELLSDEVGVTPPCGAVILIR